MSDDKFEERKREALFFGSNADGIVPEHLQTTERIVSAGEELMEALSEFQFANTELAKRQVVVQQCLINLYRAIQGDDND